MHVNYILSLIFVLGIQTCWGKGAPWSAEEQDIIFQKVKFVALNGNKVVNQYKNLHPGYEFNGPTKVNPMKILRLGFHDCLTYSDSLDEGEINGCDGCLNPTGMNIRPISRLFFLVSFLWLLFQHVYVSRKLEK